MFWIILIIVIIALIVHNNNKKKKSAASTPSTPAPVKPVSKSAAKLSSSEEAALSGIDHDAFAKAFAHMSGAGDSPPVKPEQPPKPEPAKDPADELAGIDHDAVARAMARMNGEPASAETPKPEPKPDDTERFKAFLAKILGYYHSMWNKEDGSLYTELDSTMPIDHFAIQVRENCLVESVWLIGDSIPLVTETAYSKLCGDSPVYDRMDDPEMQQKLLVLIGKFLTELGTVEIRGNDFYPIRAKKAAPPPAEPEKPSGGKAAEEFDEADQEAKLRAQVQAMLNQQKQDDQK